MTTLEEIRAGAGDTFPTWTLKDAKDVACFFSAAFLGRNDVIHVHAAAPPNVLLVDRDEAKLMEMHRVYGMEHWRFVVGDCYEAARALRKNGEAFDVVVVDPWSNGIDVALRELPLWCALSRKYVVIGVTKDWLDGKRLVQTPGAIASWIASEHWNGEDLPFPPVELRWRSAFIGGVYWLVLVKEVRCDSAF